MPDLRLLFSVFFAIASILIYAFPKSTESSSVISDVTLVTAWYPHPGYSPKYPNQTAYRDGVRELFSRMQTPLVVFAPPEEAQFLRSARPDGLPMVLNHSYETIWDVPPLKSHVHSFHTKQRELALLGSNQDAVDDTAHMYGVWNAKPFFLEQVALTDPFNSSFYFWLDAATWLPYNGLMAIWPDPHRIRNMLPASKGWEDNVLVNVREPKPCLEQEYFSDQNAPLERTIAGVFFGGSKKAVEWLSDIFYETMEYYMSLEEFVGIDEQTLLAIAMLHPKRFVSIPLYWYRDPTLETNEHVWYFLEYLATDEEGMLRNNSLRLRSAPLFEQVPYYMPCDLTRKRELRRECPFIGS